AILAASLSSIDSAINSCTSVAIVDIYNRFTLGAGVRAPATAAAQAAQVRMSRIATVGFGLTGTLLAMNVSRIRTLLEIANKLINACSGPLFAIYLLAMFSRRATSGAVLAGGCIGTLVSYFVAYHTGISFLWPSAFGLVATIASASIVSAAVRAMGGAHDRRGEQLTWYSVMSG